MEHGKPGNATSPGGERPGTAGELTGLVCAESCLGVVRVQITRWGRRLRCGAGSKPTQVKTRAGGPGLQVGGGLVTFTGSACA